VRPPSDETLNVLRSGMVLFGSYDEIGERRAANQREC
jgi:hypothetical protein